MENNNTETCPAVMDEQIEVKRVDQSECSEANEKRFAESWSIANTRSASPDKGGTNGSTEGSSDKGVKRYVFSGKFDEIRQDTLILEYIGNDIFLDDNGRKYVYDSKEDSMYALDEISGERSYKLN